MYTYIFIFDLAEASEIEGDEFWDYDRQVDLEGFSSQTLYDILSRQSRAATQELGKQKEEVRKKNKMD